MVIFLLVLQRRYPDSRGMFFGVTERGITGLRGDLSVLKKTSFYHCLVLQKSRLRVPNLIEKFSAETTFLVNQTLEMS